MARTSTEINADRLTEILRSVEDQPNPPVNHGVLFGVVAHEYNQDCGDFKPISNTQVAAYIKNNNVVMKTPLGRAPKGEVSVTEEKPDGTPVPKTKKSKKKTPVDSGINVVRIPQGRQPLPLTDFSHESILSWVDRQREVGKTNEEYFSRDALEYFVRKVILPDNVEKRDEVCRIIRDNVKDEF